MIIYNVTVNINEEVHDEWITWMRTEHIPEMLATGKFIKALMTRVLVQEQMGGTTYSVQYMVRNKKTLQQYYKEDADRMRKKSEKFKDQYVAFRTEMEVVSEQE